MTIPGGLPTGQIPVEPAISGPSAAMPGLEFAFSARVELLEPVEQGTVNGLRLRFVPIRGGVIGGPRLSGRVLPGGGDWQSIRPDGLTKVRALYQLQADDGTVISIENTGVRSASPAVTDRINRGEAVGPDDYYFRTTPRFTVEDGVHGWLARSLFIARAIRMPDHVIVDFYTVT